MKRIQLFFLFVSLHLASFSTHIIGGDITVKQLSGSSFNSYLVTLHIYRDCSPGTAGFDKPSITIGLFDKVTNAIVDSFYLPFVSYQAIPFQGDICYLDSSVCVEEGIYQDTIINSFPNNPNGYYLSWQRCCRNSIIENIVSPNLTSIAFYTEIPDPSISNSTPVFNTYINTVFCNSLSNTNFSATDSDGDQLVYSLITPLAGNPNTNAIPPISPGPYPSIVWKPPYNSSDMIGGTIPMSINPTTGILTTAPITIGTFEFTVRVEEYRNSIKIGEVRRDVQCRVLSCAPTYSFSLNGSNYEVISHKLNWHYAAACAASKGGYLVEINNKQEQDSVYDAIVNVTKAAVALNYTSVPDGDSVAYVWIGANDKALEGIWLWDGNDDNIGTNFWMGEGSGGLGGGNAVSGSYINWGAIGSIPEEPNNFANQDAAGMSLTGWKSSSAGQWNDLNDSTKLYYVIEYNNLSSINNIKKENAISIFPNPNDGVFKFSHLEKNSNIEIFDISGKLIYSNQTQESSVIIDIRDKSKGLYFYKITNKNQEVFQGKIVVQ